MQVFTFFCQGVGSKTQLHIVSKKLILNMKTYWLQVVDYPEIMLNLIQRKLNFYVYEFQTKSISKQGK